jgi:hypothetical protein
MPTAPSAYSGVPQIRFAPYLEPTVALTASIGPPKKWSVSIRCIPWPRTIQSAMPKSVGGSMTAFGQHR